MWVLFERVYGGGGGVVLVWLVRFVGGSVDAGLGGGVWLVHVGRVVL